MIQSDTAMEAFLELSELRRTEPGATGLAMLVFRPPVGRVRARSVAQRRGR
jgi:hypothetical protein